MKKIIFLSTFFLGSISIFAQGYRSAIGLRLGTGIGVSATQLLTKNYTIEGILKPTFANDEFSVDLLLKQHHKIISKRVNIFMGAGVHKVWRNELSDQLDFANAGVSGIIGGEMAFGKFNLSWDYKPTVDVVGGKNQFHHHSAITLRYVILKKKKKKINWKFWEKDKKKKRKKKKKKNASKDNSWNWKFWEK